MKLNTNYLNYIADCNMSEWKEYKLGEVCSFVKDKISIRDVGAKVYISTENMLPEKGGITRASSIPMDGMVTRYYPETVLISNIRPYFKKIWFADKEGGCSNDVLCFKGNDVLINSKYLYYLLAQDIFFDYVMLGSKGSKMPRGDKDHIMKWKVSIAPVDEQKRIAGVLSSLDDKIDLLHRENATLEALAETLFRHYFIENPCRGVGSADNPDWKEGKLGDYVIETIGGEWGKEIVEGEYDMPVRCLRGADVADLNDGLANRAPLRYIKRSKYEKIKPLNGDIILEISGGTDTCSTGRVAYINDDIKRLFDYPIVFSNFCRLLRVDEQHSFFVYCFFRYLHKQGEFFNLENGSSGIHNLNYKAALYEMDWSVPTDEKSVIEFNERVKPYFDKINANKKQILLLSSQRDTLLPRLMSDEVKVL